MTSRCMQSIFLACFLVSASGCWGGGSRNVYVNRTTTIGQELDDLQRAHAKGAISDSEYQEQKKRIMTPDAAD